MGGSYEAAPVAQSYGVRCPPGSYCPENIAYPIKCPNGTYQPDEGKTQFGDCKGKWKVDGFDEILLIYLFQA